MRNDPRTGAPKRANFQVVASPEQIAELARKIREQEANTPEREEYLERIAEQIRAGTYEVDNDALARKLVDHLTDISEAD